jgi:hypothetical protein
MEEMAVVEEVVVVLHQMEVVLVLDPMVVSLKETHVVFHINIVLDLQHQHHLPQVHQQ